MSAGVHVFAPKITERPRAIPGIPHPIPYQGSKRQLARLIVDCLPMNVDRLIEPFCGSAAVSLAAAHLGRAERFVLSDVNAPLMELWKAILHEPDALIAGYRRLWTQQLGDERQFYDHIRARFNREHRPNDFLYLLARCVKAAIRYNSQGRFNNSPDNRRKGAHPDTMAWHIHRASQLLSKRAALFTRDYQVALDDARPTDVVYLDPPYQGVCRTHNHRYLKPVDFPEFVHSLEALNARDVPFIVSYDGRTGEKVHGRKLPDALRLVHFEVPAGRSTTETLLGRQAHTFESLYLSKSLIVKTAGKRFFSVASRQVECSLFGVDLE
jgi:DNA adenine methylase